MMNNINYINKYMIWLCISVSFLLLGAITHMWICLLLSVFGYSVYIFLFNGFWNMFP